MIHACSTRPPVEFNIDVKAGVLPSANVTPVGKDHKERRSERVALRIPVHVEYFVNDSGLLSSDSVTIVVNAHGALLRLPWGVPVGRDLLLQNRISLKTQIATVLHVEYIGDGEFDVGVEFTQPNSEFWGLTSPPNQWSPTDPDAKKGM